MQFSFFLLWQLFFSSIFLLIEISFYFSFEEQTNVVMLLSFLLLGFAYAFVMHIISLYHYIINLIREHSRDKRYIDFLLNPILFALLYFVLPISFIREGGHLAIRNKIILTAGLIAFAVYSSIVISYFIPKWLKQIALFLAGLGLFIGGGWMYVNQYHFLHQAMFFYASLPLYHFFLSFFNSNKKKFYVKQTILTGAIALLILFLLPELLMQNKKYLYQGILKTTYMKYHLSHFIDKKIKITKKIINEYQKTKTEKRQDNKAKTFFNSDMEKYSTKVQGFVVILVDALRAKSLKTYGYKRNTAPNLHLFASENVVFKNYYTQHSSTVTTMNSIFRSDHFPWVYSTKGLKYLKKLDKVKLSAIIWAGNHYHFKYFKKYKISEQNPEKAFKKAKSYLKKRQKDKKKFILFVHIMNVHSPYNKHDKYDWGSSPQDRYDSEISYVDEYMGKFLSYFSNSKSKQSTMLIITADHGEEFRDHGGRHHNESVYEEIMHVPFIASIPSIKTKGLKVTIECGHTDLMPTFIYSLSKNPKKFAKHYFRKPRENIITLATLTEKNKISNYFPKGRFVFSHTMRHFFLGPTWSIVNNNYKWILRYRSGIEELYNLKKDPAEKNNLLIEKISLKDKEHFTLLKDAFWDFYINKYRYVRKRKRESSRKFL